MIRSLRRQVGAQARWRVAALVVAVALLGAAPARPALAQSTGLVIDVDATVALGCLDPFASTITAEDLSAAFTGGIESDASVALTTGSLPAGISGNALTVRLPRISQPLSGNIRRYELTEVGCIIRASPSFGSVRVRTSLTGNRVLSGPAGSRITVNSVRARRFGTTDNFGRSYTYPAWLHFFDDTLIEFRINIDLSEANAAGLHANGTGGTFTVEVTSP